MDLSNKKFLVTGGAGFIGSHAVDALLDAGANVCVVDNLLTGRRENLNSKARFYETDVADKNAVQKIFNQEQPEFVYHFAFNTRATESMKDPLFDIDSIMGTINMLKNAQQYKIKKFVFLSSGFVYGNTPCLPTPETEPLDTVSPYCVAKYAAESYVRFFHKAYNMPYVILRFSTTYGPRQIIGAMPDYIRQLRAGKQAEFWGNPSEKTRDYLYVGDVVRAVLLALEISDDHLDPTFNISTGKEISLKELYEKIAEILGVEARPILRPERPGEQIRYLLDSAKFRKTTRWESKVNIEQGLHITIGR